MDFLYARHPRRLEAEHSRIVEDLLALADAGRQDAVDAMVGMLEDLHERGLESRFVKKLEGLPIWELKTRARGGPKGGARVYFFVTEVGAAVLVNAESKAGNEASTAKFKEVLEVIRAYRSGEDVARRKA